MVQKLTSCLTQNDKILLTRLLSWTPSLEDKDEHMIKIEKFVNFSNMECKLRFHCTSLCMRFQVINRLSSILFNILFIIFQFLIKIFELFSILDDLSLYKHNFKSDVDVLLRYSNVITSQKFI